MIHAVLAALGNSIAIMLTTDNTHDITVDEKSISLLDFKGAAILTNRAYSKWKRHTFIVNRDAGFWSLPKGGIISIRGMSIGGCAGSAILWKLSLKFKVFRRSVNHFDKLASRFICFVHFCIRI